MDNDSAGSDWHYDAFLSYSTDPDYYLVRDIESFLESFHRLKTPTQIPLKRLKICVDSSALQIGPLVGGDRRLVITDEIERLVEDRLRCSRRLVVFFSERTKQSRWVDWEIRWFLKNRGADEIWIALTGGSDPESGTEQVFSRTVLDAGLDRRVWYDFRGYDRFVARRWTKVRNFDDERTRLAADLLGYSAEEIQPFWVRQQRKRVRGIIAIASTVAVVTTGLAISAVVARDVAEQRRLEAERQARVAQCLRYSTEARVEIGTHRQRALLMAYKALGTLERGDPRVPAAEQALRDGLSGCGGRGLSRVSYAAVSADGRAMYTSDGARLTRWDLGGCDLRGVQFPFSDSDPRLDFVAASPVGHLLAAVSSDHTVRLWDMSGPDAGNAPLILPAFDGGVWSVRFSPDASWLVGVGNRGPIHLWDLRGPGAQPIPHLLTGHEGYISHVSFTGDRRWLITGGGDGTTRLWRLAGAKPGTTPVVLNRNVRPPGRGLSAPSPDGRWLVTVSPLSSGARLWDLHANDPAAAHVELKGHGGYIESLAMSPDSRWAATASLDHTVRVWDLSAPDPSGSPVKLPLAERVGPLATAAEGKVAFSPSGRLFARGRGSVLQSWEAPYVQGELTSRPIRSRTDRDDYELADFAISPDGRWLITAAATVTGESRVWDLSAKEPFAACEILRGYEGALAIREFSRNGRWLVTVDGAGMGRLWDLENRDFSSDALVLRGHRDVVARLAFTPDGRRIVTAGSDGAARLWELPELCAERMNPRVLRRPQSPAIYSLMITPDGRWVVARSDSLGLWDLTSPDPDQTFVDLGGADPRWEAAQISADGRWLGAYGGRRVALWELTSGGARRRLFVVPDDQGRFTGLALSPHGQWLAAAGLNGTVLVWDLTSEPRRFKRLQVAGTSSPVTHLSFTGDDRGLVGAAGRSAYLWMLNRDGPSDPPTEFPVGETDCNLVRLSHDDRWLLATCGRSTRLWDMKPSFVRAVPYELKSGIKYSDVLDFSPDGRWLVMAGFDGLSRLWRLPKFENGLRSFELPTGGDIAEARISPDSAYLATASVFGSIQLWDLRGADPTVGVVALRGHRVSTSAMRFSPDGRWLATGGTDATACLWPLQLTDLLNNARVAVGRNFGHREWSQSSGEPYPRLFADLPELP
jgi:WD40 repeat protein